MFRIQANMFLAKTSQRSMPLDQAVKFLHAAKFNVEKAEEILKNYEVHVHDVLVLVYVYKPNAQQP